MRINHQTRLEQAKTELQNLEKAKGRGAEVTPSQIKHAGLKAVARQLATGCSASVGVSALKQNLKTLGKEITKADSNKDGYINGTEARALSRLAQSLLEVAAQPARPSSGGTVSSGCNATSTRRYTPVVSSGCGSSSPVVSRPEPAPRRPVSTGCAAPAPSRPIRTGC